MEKVFKIVAIIVYILVSIAIFLGCYNTFGIHLTPSTLLQWAFVIAAWVTISWVILVFSEFA